MANKRIEFIDLAKGLCIILVVMYHCGLGGMIPGDKQLRMPLYFVLSGLFFKDYGRESLIKKTNKLLIPYITFYIIGDLFYWTAYKIGALPVSPKETPVLDLLFGGIPCDLPIWFLLCLFNCYVIFLFIYRISKSKNNIMIYSAIAGAIGVGLSFLMPSKTQFFISSAFSAIPFFCLGYLLKETTILQYTHHKVIDLLMGGVIYCISIGLIALFPTAKFSVFDNTFHGNIVMSYIISGLLVLSVLLICKFFKRIPYISYIGQFSIIILLIHVPIMEIVYYIQRSILHYEANWLRALLTILLASSLIIPIKRFAPYICAQKDILDYNRICFTYSKIIKYTGYNNK